MTLLHSKCAFIDEQTDKMLSRSQLQHNDILIAIAGAIGRAAMVSKNDLPANTNQAVGIIRPRIDIIMPKYMVYYLSSLHCQRHLSESAVQSAQANLSLSQLGRTAVALPSYSEQKAIIEHLDDAIAHIDDTSKIANCEIELLREYRTRLIADVVTGKLDVREATAHLPEEAEEPECIDEADELADTENDAQSMVIDTESDEAAG